MDIYCKLLLHISLAVLLRLGSCNKLTEDEKFAMELFKQVFVTRSSTMIHTATFREIRHDNLKDNIIAYQRMHSLNVTGILDEKTIIEMKLPRCGVPDVADMTQSAKRKKRYALWDTKWDNSSPLTYYVKSYTPDLNRSTIDRILAKAFQIWSDVTNIDFRIGTPGNIDIEILFVSRSHGDGSPFDGPSFVLAHAFYPQRLKLDYAGDVHFDLDENWTDQTGGGTNLLHVAVHEIGHSLGLRHSSVDSAIMFPTYSYSSTVELDPDDILGIQSLYGTRTQPTTTKTTTAIPITSWDDDTQPTTAKTTTAIPTTPSPDYRRRFCASGRLDAITNFQGVTIAFKDDLFAVLTTTGIASGYPWPIARTFDGLQGVSKIDAALSWNEHATPRLYLFAGNEYWKFDMYGAVANYPKKISEGFRGLPNNISAAFVWIRNGCSYVFKGDQYYRLQGSGASGRGSVDRGYPRAKSVWNIDRALPNIDAVFNSGENDRTYMFGGDNYILYDDYTFTVQTNPVPYPRNTKYWWFQCDVEHLRDLTKMEVSNDHSHQIAILPQADFNDHILQINSAAVCRQWSSIVLSIVITFKLLIN